MYLDYLLRNHFALKGRRPTMKILVIGNGFDLAHYLPTHYSDFLDFVKEFKEESGGDYEAFIRDVKNNRVLRSKIEGMIAHWYLSP